jgi:hypothetical protein
VTILPSFVILLAIDVSDEIVIIYYLYQAYLDLAVDSTILSYGQYRAPMNEDKLDSQREDMIVS